MGIRRIEIEGDGKTGYQKRLLVFYLAMEEFVAAHREWDEAVFFWRVPPTVIFGRNQIMSSEVNIDWCREHGVKMFRRKSGGGCVYSDLGNLMISYVSSDTDVHKVFDRYMTMVADALKGLGVNAEVSGRNDILIDGRKVSGNAFQLLGDRSIVHGTMLYDSDFDALERAITPSQSKIQSKGVSSVRRHVTNLKPCLPVGSPVTDIDSLADYLAERLCDSQVYLDAGAVSGISEIEKTYLDPAFIAGHEANAAAGKTGLVSTEGRVQIGENPAIEERRDEGRVQGVGNFAIEMRLAEGRVQGVGNLAIEVRLAEGHVSDVHLSGDYFALAAPAEIDAALTSALKGLSLEREAVLKAMAGLGSERLIPGLSPRAFVGVLFNETE